MVEQLFLTGRPVLLGADGRRRKLPRKAFVLAAWLVLERPDSGMTRQEAARLLWDGTDTTRLAGNMRQLILRIAEEQRVGGFELFDFDSDELSLKKGRLTVDVDHIVGVPVIHDRHELRRLFEYYRGDLLLGAEDGSVKLLNWLRPMRMKLKSDFAALVSSYLEGHGDALAIEDALAAAKHLLEVEPDSEVALRTMMRVHITQGALEVANRVGRRLQRSLDASKRTPSEETNAIFRLLVGEAAAGGGLDARNPPEPTGTVDTPRVLRDERESPKRLPRLLIGDPLFESRDAGGGEWVGALFDDMTIRIWQSRFFSIVRGGGPALRSDPGGLEDRTVDVDYVLEWRLVERAGAPALVVELVRPTPREILWICELEAGGSLAAAVHQVVSGVVHQIEQCELRALFANEADATAYRLTVQGKRLLKAIDLQSLRRGRQILRSALTLDPNYAQALAGISKSYRLEWLRLARGGDDEIEAAVEFARRAVAAEPDAACGYHQLGIASIYRRDFDFGLEALERATRLLPYDEELLSDYADALVHAGETQTALETLAPLLAAPFTLSDYTLWIAASAYYLAGRYADAITLLNRLSSKDSAHQLRAACHAMLSEDEMARFYVAHTKEVLPDFTIDSRLNMVPFRRAEDLEHYRMGLQRAGFD